MKKNKKTKNVPQNTTQDIKEIEQKKTSQKTWSPLKVKYKM